MTDPVTYGYCPQCGGKVVSRERRPNGNDICENEHIYPSRNTVENSIKSSELTDEQIVSKAIREDYDFYVAKDGSLYTVEEIHSGFGTGELVNLYKKSTGLKELEPEAIERLRKRFHND